MALTNPNKVVTEERLNEYHQKILPYLGGNSMVACGGGYAPIGTVIAYMGTSAPSDFLICDGTVYTISDYTELADFFEAQFGSSNFFGGDGNTTFAVPDLRGEFLRGTGTNSHTNQGSGENVGIHQDGTIHKQISATDQMYIPSTPSPSDNNSDKILNPSAQCRYVQGTVYNMSSFSKEAYGNYTSRPTNTSVLYCIKAKSQGNGYSLDEQIVGTWIDGKPIYQKTIDCGYLPAKASKTVSIGVSGIDNVVSYEAICRDSTNNIFIILPFAHVDNNYSILMRVQSNNIFLYTETPDYSTYYTIATVQYTKTD